MFAYLIGEITQIDEDEVFLEVNNIGYEVFMPKSEIAKLKVSAEEIKIYTHFQVREDAFIIYGFTKEKTRSIFKKLITVNGIGPKGALAILSELTIDELISAILSDDEKTISKANGIGAKTAKRLIIELKDKIDVEGMVGIKDDDVADEKISLRSEAIDALSVLGYSKSEAFKAISGLNITDYNDVESLLKDALKNLALL